MTMPADDRRSHADDVDLTPSDISPDTHDTQSPTTASARDNEVPVAGSEVPTDLNREINDQSRDRLNPKNQSNQIGEDERATAKATDDTQDNEGLRNASSGRAVPADYGRKENANARPPGSENHGAVDIERPTPISSTPRS